MLPAFCKLLRTASIVICLIVAGSFLVFAVDRTGAASSEQQSTLNEGRGPATKRSSKQSGLHEALDRAASTFTSPFAGIVSASKSEWGDHMVKLLLTLLVYGFGLGFAARMIRVRT